jgi:hypothetical protein
LQDATQKSSHLPGETASDLNAVFPHKVCLNLDRRSERWQCMRRKFALHEIHDVQRFAAVDGERQELPGGWSATPGAYGCLLSHLEIVNRAREGGVSNILIFEDDVVFATPLQENFPAYYKQVPPDWEMLYFGALHMEEPIEISQNVRQIRRAFSTYAYALKHTIFDPFIELNSRSSTAVDVNNLALQREHACYCFTPHLAWVETGPSDAQGRDHNHWYLQYSLVIRGSGMDRLLAQTAVVIAYRNSTRSDSVAQNLHFLLRFYRTRLPGIRLVIVEQDIESTIAEANLPEGTQYLLLRDAGPLNKGRCFNAGRSSAPADCRFLIFSDSDILVEEWDLCGNLRMCERYDCTTGFSGLTELTPADTRELYRDEMMLMRWFDVQKYSHTRNHGFSNYYICNRQSVQNAGGWDEKAEAEIDLLSLLRSEDQMRVFDSPNRGFRLHHD